MLEDFFNVRSVQRLVFEQGLGQCLDCLSALFKQDTGAFVGFVNDTLHLGVDLLGRVFAVLAGTGNITC